MKLQNLGDMHKICISRKIFTFYHLYRKNLNYRPSLKFGSLSDRNGISALAIMKKLKMAAVIRVKRRAVVELFVLQSIRKQSCRNSPQNLALGPLPIFKGQQTCDRSTLFVQASFQKRDMHGFPSNGLNGVFQIFSTIQECQYCHLCFSRAI